MLHFVLSPGRERIGLGYGEQQGLGGSDGRRAGQGGVGEGSKVQAPLKGGVEG